MNNFKMPSPHHKFFKMKKAPGIGAPNFHDEIHGYSEGGEVERPESPPTPILGSGHHDHYSEGGSVPNLDPDKLAAFSASMQHNLPQNQSDTTTMNNAQQNSQNNPDHQAKINALRMMLRNSR